MRKFRTLLSAVALSVITVAGPGASAAHAATWSACGFLDKDTKTVRTFGRSAGAGFSAGKAILACGFQGWDGETGWGFRHIRHGHEGDWARITTMVGGTWQGAADWSMAQALKGPAYVTYTKRNDTYTYRTPIYIYDRQGKMRYSFYSNVVVAAKTQNIITAYPAVK
jgi:hypothetical protein